MRHDVSVLGDKLGQGGVRRAFESVVENLAFLGNEDAISLKPMFVRHLEMPNVVIVPIADKGAIWDVFVAWQRGKTALPVRALIDSLG